MKQSLPLPQSASLRMKLVLSYLAVTLGSILVMVIVVAIAVPNYFYISQINELRGETQTWAQDFAALYQSNNYNWEELNIGPIVRLPRYLVISDLQGQKYGLGTKLI